MALGKVVPPWVHALVGVLSGGLATPSLLAGDAIASGVSEREEARIKSKLDSREISSDDVNKEVLGNVGQFLNNVTGVTSGQQFTSSEREAAQAFTHQENQLARAWQERMSNTAIQRQVSDAQAAGINPLALFSSGTSGAGVGVASGSSMSAAAGSSGNSAAAVSSAISSLTHLLSTVAKIAA